VKAQSKVGSTANMKHKPGGGDKKVSKIPLNVYPLKNGVLV